MLRSPTPVWYIREGVGWNQKRPTRTITAIAPRANAIAGFNRYPGPSDRAAEAARDDCPIRALSKFH